MVSFSQLRTSTSTPTTQRTRAARIGSQYSQYFLHRLALLIAVTSAASLAVATEMAAATSGHAAFIAENDTAMTRMIAGMHVPPTGDVDRDFATMMIAHHQGAIDMAQAQLRYGRNQQLRRIAHEIIVEQQQEIAAMRVALASTPVALAVHPTTQDALRSPPASSHEPAHVHSSH